VLYWFAAELSPVVLSCLTTAIMLIVATWESLSLSSGPGESRSEAAQSDATSA
jgi:hypothetical protein